MILKPINEILEGYEHGHFIREGVTDCDFWENKCREIEFVKPSHET